jgi:hypothetical protein
MRRTLTALAGIIGVLGLATSPAGAGEGGGGGGFDQDTSPPPPSMEIEGHTDAWVPGMTLTGSSDPNCTAPGGHTGPATSEEPPESQAFYFEHAEDYYAPAAGQPGVWRMRYCGGWPDQIIFIPANGGGFGIQLDGVLPIMLEAPTIRMNPDEDEHQLVGLPSWLWVEVPAAVADTREVVPGITLSLGAESREVRWDMGDGTPTKTCDRGRPYDPSIPADQQQPTCEHTYTTSSAGRPGDAFEVTVTVEWVAVSCAINGRTCTPAEWPAAVTTTATRSVVVAEREALARTTER